MTLWRPAVIFVKTFSDMKIQTESLNDREYKHPLSPLREITITE